MVIEDYFESIIMHDRPETALNTQRCASNLTGNSIETDAYHKHISLCKLLLHYMPYNVEQEQYKIDGFCGLGSKSDSECIIKHTLLYLLNATGNFLSAVLMQSFN